MSEFFPAVLGVDGCRAGWLSVLWSGPGAEVKLHHQFTDVLAELAAIIAVDMPIGLPDQNGRKAEAEARKVLGRRSSSVFSTPSEAAVQAKDWETACLINLQHSNPPRKLSKQSFGLVPKIREIDVLISPLLQRKVHEVHPEVSFYHMNERQPLQFNKKTKEGENERQNLLKCAGFPIFDLSLQIYRRKLVARDDIVDACACAWTARRIQLKLAQSYPFKPEVNGRGLQMQIKA